VSYGPDPDHKHPTTYFRRAFSAGNDVQALFLKVMYDDGFVFYINGHEGGRAGMPSGPITFATPAFGHEAGASYAMYDISSQIPRLRDGELNTLAVEVHQHSPSSSDLVFDAELIAWTSTPASTTTYGGIPRGSYWKLWDRGGDLGTAWRGPGHDDDGWSAGPGPLGHGEPYLATEIGAGPITTYFRETMIIDDPAAVTELLGEVMYDDGFVAYLNGVEIGRAGMPAGTPAASTLASSHEAGQIYEGFDWSAAVPLLVPGPNTLAVEIHQNSPASSDLVFDLSLRVSTGAWHTQPSGTDAALLGVWFLDASRGWVVGDGGTLVRTVDGGATWAPQPSGTSRSLRAIQFVDDLHGWIVGDQGAVLATSDGGETWALRSADVNADFVSLSFITATTGWVATRGSDVYRTRNGGLSWTRMPTGTGGSFHDLHFVDGLHGWLVGSVPVPGDTWAAIYYTADGGVTWIQQWISGRHFSYLFDVEAVGTDTAWAVGQSSLSGVGEVKWFTHDTGATWELAPATDNGVGIFAVDFIDDTTGWGVGFAGSIIRSDDAGATWTVQQEARMHQRPSLYDVHFVDGDVGWAVGEGGAILTTTTGGQ